MSIRTALAVPSLVAVLLLAGCTGAGGGNGDAGTAVPTTTTPAGGGDVTFLTELRLMPELADTDEQELLDAGQAACQARSSGAGDAEVVEAILATGVVDDEALAQSIDRNARQLCPEHYAE